MAPYRPLEATPDDSVGEFVAPAPSTSSHRRRPSTAYTHAQAGTSRSATQDRRIILLLVVSGIISWSYYFIEHGYLGSTALGYGLKDGVRVKEVGRRMNRTEKIQSLYGMGWAEGRSWVDHINSLDDAGLAPATKFTQEYIYNHQNPPLDECAGKKFFVAEPVGISQEHGHGLGSAVHMLSFPLMMALESDRIMMWGKIGMGNAFVDKECTVDGLKSMDCVFEPLSHCPRSLLNDGNTIWGEVQYPVRPFLHLKPADVPTVLMEKLIEVLPFTPTKAMTKYWWRGQAAAYFLRPHRASLAHISRARLDTSAHVASTMSVETGESETFAMPFPLHSGTQSMHVRHGDKASEMGLHGLEAYVDLAEELASMNPNSYARMGFVSSEDPAVMDKTEVLTNVRGASTTPNVNWMWFTSHIKRANGSPFLQLKDGNRSEVTLGWMAETFLVGRFFHYLVISY
ncbi:hypothetical protein MNV49_005971 [Pseudohyphozyma bogoriensis]|nr:hypothetical protein MNV49_005971 [Pseudohyphozyma bogoriensis]